ncbi:Tn3 family transposase, partial [Salmonella enterica subsp. enterica serovar Derby]|nr:Tn3 family transposase [Salmonella enterica subsp. enterica serovar Derby]
PNRKYFGNNRGITWYNFVSDQYSGFHRNRISERENKDYYIASYNLCC